MLYRVTLLVESNNEELKHRILKPREALSHCDIIDNFFEPLSKEEQKKVIELYEL